MSKFFGSRIQWEAVEKDGEYSILMMSSDEVPASGQLVRFYRKINDTLDNKTISKRDFLGGKAETLEDHGNIDIRYSDE